MTTPTPLSRLIFRIAFALVGVTTTVIASTLQPLTDYFKIPLENGGLFTSAFFIGASLTILIGGNLLDRVPSRRISMTGATLVGVSLLVLSFTPIAVIGFASVFFFGMGNGLLIVCGNTLAPRYNPESPARELSAINFFFGLGAIVGPQLANFAFSTGDFRLMYWVVGATALLLAVVFNFLPSFPPRTKSDVIVKVKWVNLIPFAILLFAYVGVEIGFSAWISPQITLVALSSVATGSVAISLFWTGLTIGRFITSFIAGRVSGDWLLIFGIGGVGIGVAGVLLFPATEIMLLIMSFVVGFGCAPIFPIGLALLNERYPDGFGTISGVIIAIGNGGAIFLPAIQGQVGGGVNGGMIVPLIAAGVMMVCAFIAKNIPKPTGTVQA